VTLVGVGVGATDPTGDPSGRGGSAATLGVGAVVAASGGGAAEWVASRCRDSRDGFAGTGSEHRELQLEAEAADPCPVRIDRGQPATRGGQRRGIVTAGSAVGPGHQLGADGIDRLVEERPDVAAALLEAVEERDAGRAVARHQMVDEGRHDLRVGESEQVTDGRFLDDVRGGREELVEHRLGVAHAARSQSGDEVDGSRIGLRPSAARIRPSLPSISAHGQATDVEPLEARQDGGGKPDGSVEANMKTTKSGGSSSDFSRAFQASRVIWCASSRM
jgi:hypothetical protein